MHPLASTASRAIVSQLSIHCLITTSFASDAFGTQVSGVAVVKRLLLLSHLSKSLRFRSIKLRLRHGGGIRQRLLALIDRLSLAKHTGALVYFSYHWQIKHLITTAHQSVTTKPTNRVTQRTVISIKLPVNSFITTVESVRKVRSWSPFAVAETSIKLYNQVHRNKVIFRRICIIVALPLALGAPVTFARLSRASFMSHLLAPPSCRAGPSPWLALWCGMVSHGSLVTS